MENTLSKGNDMLSDAPKPSISFADMSRVGISTQGKTAAEYTYEAMKLHSERGEDKGYAPPKFVKWLGDAALAVLPSNRLCTAAGLTSGLLLAGNTASIATGYTLLNEPVKNVPTFLQWMQGKVKDYNPNGLDARSKWIKYAQFAVYSLGGLFGAKVGSDIAYKNTKKSNENPNYLEEYLTNVSHIQGETWGWLAAASAIWGSSAGTWMLPIPGMNYATGIVGRVTSMQDRNTMVAGLSEFTSGSTTPSYLRLKEGMHYLTYYAVGNPAKEPAQIEFLAYTLLGPIFKDKLTADHIKQFTDAVYKVRDQYWQEGGIPKEKKAEALSTMKEVFTGAGLEVLLIEMGLNPATVDFGKVNGVIGKIGNVGKGDDIHKKQEEYWKALEERLPKYVAAGIVTQERADWVKEGITLTREHKTQETLPPLHADVVVPKTEVLAESLGVKAKQGALENLIRSASKQGDWREKVLSQRQNMDSPRLVVE